MADKVNNSGKISLPNYGNKVTKKENIELKDISIFYSTTKTEENRSTFDETFEEEPASENEQAEQFAQGLIDNKETICERLGLDEEKYDALSCIALGLASQETGMGEEDGYVDENTNWFTNLTREIGKLISNDSTSFSSGLTQAKIYDFMNGNELNDEEKQLLKDLGVDASGKYDNNLFKNPDIAAAATVVILNSILNNYDNYENMLSSNHEKIGARLDSTLTDEEKNQKGEDILTQITDLYENASDKDKKELREDVKSWLLAYDGSKYTDKDLYKMKYIEQVCLNDLNKKLQSMGADFTLEQSDLDYIRYYLTNDDQKMTQVEYCAYAWNHGTGTSGMKLDRTLADKIGTILSNPESFDYNQFVVNVNTLATSYAEQSLGENGEELLNRALEQ